MWFENFTEPDMIEVYEYRMAWRYNWGNNTDGTTPYLLSCKIPQNKNWSCASIVSFTENRCDAANNLFKFMQNDQIPYHDSLYENLYMYEYLIPMDVDEFIIPIKTEDRTWEDLIKRTISSVND
ncbi:hypothetical protein PVAND_016731 [Polypedilum vanderplanki]|uniref:Glycosyltransferase family 92 protein n=1 Tax=Polypedilum vanderplanki TaxID=319348 RepID=A0A9J6BGV2_POLVA|nr:hypothetical protein PVAND_016731 [Polypedilum vanderplanki]